VSSFGLIDPSDDKSNLLNAVNGLKFIISLNTYLIDSNFHNINFFTFYSFSAIISNKEANLSLVV